MLQMDANVGSRKVVNCQNVSEIKYTEKHLLIIVRNG
jgi:hypothetical protein